MNIEHLRTKKANKMNDPSRSRSFLSNIKCNAMKNNLKFITTQVMILAAVITSIPLFGQTIETITVNGTSFNMIYVAGGTFMMGGTSEQGEACYANELPVHQVTVNDFSIGETEVTQGLWNAVMGEDSSQQLKWDNLHELGDSYPVCRINWIEIQEFITKLNQQTGLTFRLPTEAEWEFAARGGNQSRHYKYSGSDSLEEVAWMWRNSGDRYLNGTDVEWEIDEVEKNHDRKHPVKTKKANELGIYDMSGNVMELCADWYGKYSPEAQVEPKGPPFGTHRVVRGGNWFGLERYCRVSFRHFRYLDYPRSELGFRLVLVHKE